MESRIVSPEELISSEIVYCSKHRIEYEILGFITGECPICKKEKQSLHKSSVPYTNKEKEIIKYIETLKRRKK